MSEDLVKDIQNAANDSEQVSVDPVAYRLNMIDIHLSMINENLLRQYKELHELNRTMQGIAREMHKK